MDKLEKALRLKKMLAQVAPGNTLESIPRATRDSGLESLTATPPPHETGLEKLADNRPELITDTEMFGLEAIVMEQFRPVVFVQGDSYDNVEDPWLSLNTDTVKARISPLLSLIGRIELPNSFVLPYAGTGFIVGKGLLMTNRHVARIFSQGVGLTIQYPTGEGASAVNFKKQIDTPETDNTSFAVTGVELVHPFWDMALLRVDGLPPDKLLKLSVTSPENLVGRNIVAIGYPAKDPRNNLDVQDRIFHGKYNVKRLQPGKLRERAKVDSFENHVNAMVHDASTLGGNSGSAIIDVDNGDILALHFAGEYLKANYAVPMYELARDSRLASKLNFEGQLTPTNDWEPAWLRVAGTAEPAAEPETTKPVSAPVRAPALQSPAPAPVAAPTEPAVATWTIPIHVSISVGALPESGSASVAAPTVVEEVEEGVVVDQDYSTREGYDPNFLDGIKVPLPKISQAMEADSAQLQPDARKHGDPYELTYYHYSVYMNKKRRTAWFSAANVDGKQRPNIGARSGDRWYRDPRILKSEQMGQEAYESGIDRGHLTRRDDTAWGKDVKSATLANNDTFHFTNCALQASMFNRGKDRWQGLEQFLLEQHAKKDKSRMTVITGPIFSPHDPQYKNDKMDYSVRCPMQFWKVCVLVKEDGTPSATGFILGQDEIKDLPGFEEAFDVAATQIKISELEKRTGLSFGDLKNHDHFAQGGAPGSLEAIEGATQSSKIIRDAKDIVI